MTLNSDLWLIDLKENIFFCCFKPHLACGNLLGCPQEMNWATTIKATITMKDEKEVGEGREEAAGTEGPGAFGPLQARPTCLRRSGP